MILMPSLKPAILRKKSLPEARAFDVIEQMSYIEDVLYAMGFYKVELCLQTHGDMPIADQAPPGLKEKVMYSQLVNIRLFGIASVMLDSDGIMYLIRVFFGAVAMFWLGESA